MDFPEKIQSFLVDISVFTIYFSYTFTLMAQRITLGIILEHIQALKNDLQQQISRLDQKVDKGFDEVNRRFVEVDRKFEEARLHRQALQEDLEATIRLQSKQQKQIRRLQTA